MSVARHNCLDVHGDLNLVLPESDPMIVVLNHNQRWEAVLVPAILFYLRGGKVIHFMADWQFMIMPIVATLYRRSQVILITNKKIKPGFLNVLKPLYQHEEPAYERARQKLLAGSSVGIFPEGTINRDPNKLMRGLPGAAKLALRSGAPVLPIGIRFPRHNPVDPIPDGARMSLHIGTPLHPPAQAQNLEPEPTAVSGFHAEIMSALSELSGKIWDPRANKRRRYVV